MFEILNPRIYIILKRNQLFTAVTLSILYQQLYKSSQTRLSTKLDDGDRFNMKACTDEFPIGDRKDDSLILSGKRIVPDPSPDSIEPTSGRLKSSSYCDVVSSEHWNMMTVLNTTVAG